MSRTHSRPSIRCFNPCCRGLGSETPPNTLYSPAMEKVSILVVVDWVQRHGLVGDLPPAEVGFQSLLSWIGFRDLLRLRLFHRLTLVSILVVVDWVQRQNYGPSRWPAKWSFNPCCRGLGSETRARCSGCRSEKKFQSLLSWIGFRDCDGRGSDARPLKQFQSLLSWIGFRDHASLLV